MVPSLIMRLINRYTMRMEEFNGSPPPYDILSHTWGDEEVSFAQYSKPESRRLAGFKKIWKSCSLAKCQYVWVDTCCIDKSSSAELSEAINSMYKWYQNSNICLVYLSDMIQGERFDQNLENLRRCKWFRRGWTLQELLAPKTIYFHDRDWIYIGSRTNMSGILSKITGINETSLWNPRGASIAQKMSWAANRQTTRTEDTAYCLLGLFDVNMPLLYGEGDKAFKRLQLEILQSSSDESIFAWTDERYWTSGLLADSPDAFASSGDIISLGSFLRRPYTMTNQGLHIQLRCTQVCENEGGRFATPLCCLRSTQDPTYVTLHMTSVLFRNEDAEHNRRATRTSPFELGGIDNFEDLPKYQSFYIDDVRHPKLLPHRNYPIIWKTGGEMGDRALNLRLIGGIHARDIRPFTWNDQNGDHGSFFITDRRKPIEHNLDDSSDWPHWVIHVHWFARDGAPESLDFNFRHLDESGMNNEDWTEHVLDHIPGPIQLPAGQMLATWFRGDDLLFIALRKNAQKADSVIIDLEVENFESCDIALRHLSEADPVRICKDYPYLQMEDDVQEDVPIATTESVYSSLYNTFAWAT